MDSYILMNGLCNQSVDCVSKEIRNFKLSPLSRTF